MRNDLWNSIDWVAWLPWTVFGVVTSLTWLALDWWSRSRAPWKVRLSAIGRAAREGESRGEDRRALQSDGEQEGAIRSGTGRHGVESPTTPRSWSDDWSSSDGWLRRTAEILREWARHMTPRMLRPNSLTPDDGPTRLERRLARAGWRGEAAVHRFVLLRVVAVACGIVAATYLLGLIRPLESRTAAWAVGLIVVIGAVPDIALQCAARRRQRALEREMPDALDLLVVCVEAGQGLDHALRRIADLLSASHAVVADELDVCVRQLQIGRSRAQVLRDLGERNSSDSLRGLAAMLVQADRFGVSIGAALRSQSDALRTRRRQRAEEQAAGISVKLVFPLVLFTFPALLAVLVGPAALHLVRDLFPLLGK